MVPTVHAVSTVAGGTLGRDLVTPTVTVARHLGDEPVALGLGEPLALLGGDALSADGLPLGLALDWGPALQEKVVEACRHQLHSSRRWFSMTPCVISGPSGIGRTLMARSIARQAGVPFITLDVSKAKGSNPQRSHPGSPNIRYPSDVVLAMALSRCANPVVLVEGIETASDEVIDELQAMVDPASSPRWTESSIAALVDLSHVTWLIRSSGPLGVPRRLSHLTRVDVMLDNDARKLRALSIMAEVLADFGIDRATFRGRGGALMQALHNNPIRTAAELRKLAEKAVVAIADIV